MADVRPSIVVGAFNNRNQADEAIGVLQKAGFQNDQIRQFTGRGSERGPLTGIKSIFTAERMARGDVTRDLIDMGVAPEDTRFYQQEYEAGHPLVSVASGKRLPEATAILLNHGAYVPQAQRGAAARTSAASGATMTSTREPLTTESVTAKEPLTAKESVTAKEPLAYGHEEYGRLREEQHMRLHAEQLEAHKEQAQVGEVILRKEVITDQQSIDVPVRHEEVYIERRALAGEAGPGEVIGESQVIRIPVSDEKVNVTKHVVTTGEVVVGKREREEVQHFSDTVQHEEARWEQKGDAHIIWDQGAEPPPAQRGL